MKRIFLIALAVLFCASMAFADEVDEALSNMATEQLKASTRQMIRCGIDSEHAIKMTRNMLKNHFKAEHVLRAHEVIMNAKREELPVKPLMEKAYEGMAKRVQSGKTVQAMERVRSRYALAYGHAKGLTQEEAEIRNIGNTIAQGLAAGLHDRDVEDITYKVQQRAQEITKAEAGELAIESFRMARDMRRLGAASMSVADAVWQALDYHYTAKDMKTMRDSFITNIRYASSASGLARCYSDSISRGEGPEMLGSSSRIEANGGTRRTMGPTGSGGGSGSGGSGGSGSSGSGGLGGGSGSGGGRQGRR